MDFRTMLILEKTLSENFKQPIKLRLSGNNLIIEGKFSQRLSSDAQLLIKGFMAGVESQSYTPTLRLA